jgi:hypothetical protein
MERLMLRILLIPAGLCCFCCSPLLAEERLADGWHKSVKLTDVNSDGRASVCNAWVDEGWLIVERCDMSGDIEWQIVLAQVGEQDEPPTIEPNPNPAALGGLRLSYRDGRFFIRDDFGNLRCLRQKKSADVKWPALFIPKNEPRAGESTLKDQSGCAYYFRINHHWQFIAGGRDDEQAE